MNTIGKKLTLDFGKVDTGYVNFDIQSFKLDVLNLTLSKYTLNGSVLVRFDTVKIEMCGTYVKQSKNGI